MTLEHSIGRLLTVATIVGVVVLAIGVLAMAAAGISPLDGPPAFRAGDVPSEIVRLQPAGLLWLGLLIVIATPPLRVAAALLGYVARAEWRMAAIALAILGVIAAGIAVSLAGG
jgi:uncharacterized membrane protein